MQTNPSSPESDNNAELIPKECGEEEYNVTLFKYHGSEQGELSTAFNQFKGIINKQAHTLGPRDEIFQLELPIFRQASFMLYQSSSFKL